MDYKIIAVDTAIGQLTVMFVDSAGAEVATYAVDVPIVEGSFVTGIDLEREIQQRAPIWLLERTQLINTVSNLAHLESLVDPDYVVSGSMIKQAWEEYPMITETISIISTETNNINLL